MTLPIDPRLKPSPEQMERAEEMGEAMRRAALADVVFRCHNALNKILGGAAIRIMDNGDVNTEIALMVARSFAAIEECERELLETHRT